jgi:hypothetical protein
MIRPSIQPEHIIQYPGQSRCTNTTPHTMPYVTLETPRVDWKLRLAFSTVAVMGHTIQPQPQPQPTDTCFY